ncbi:cell wall-associated hydrolase [Secundilactobacillus collinoides DSM 20515 = JCM 1123]|uniref:Cell wall-associated hydrolase n=3 Tax=Secundilactobacillus collinoides TaxID=33960 RepID=A0A0R2BJP7_SECCO|nr:cell wall-associated hydrolase [Secundilactobacillus collinoides DSM 20515 = JCM 1123]
MIAGSFQSASAKTITVKSGDTVSALAKKYGVSASALEKTNHITKDRIFAGQKITLPGTTKTTAKTTTKANAAAAKTTKLSSTSTAKTTTSKTTYTVKSGDTLWAISSRYGVTVSQIKKWNNLSSDSITTGQKLAISASSAKTSTSTSSTTASTKKATTKTSSTTATTKKTTTKKTTSSDKADAVSSTSTASVASYAVKLASEKIPYVWGGASLKGMDCSGLTMYVYQHAAGITLPHNTVSQESMVSKHAVSKAQVGDLLFWGSAGATYHVAIYIGNNEYVAAPEPGEDVQIQTISSYFMPSFAGTVNS